MDTLYEGHGWTLQLETAALLDGRTTTKARAHFADTVHIIALTDDDNILLLREYRPFYKEWVYMLPSGHVDKEKDATVAAKRELQEETGYKAGSMKLLWSSNTKDNLAQMCHVYLATELTPSKLQQDDDELIEVIIISPKEALQKVLNQTQIHFPSAVALMKFLASDKSK